MEPRIMANTSDQMDAEKQRASSAEVTQRPSGSIVSLFSKFSNPLKRQISDRSGNTHASIAEGEVEEGLRYPPQQGDAFTSDGGGGIVFKTNSWWQTGALMAAEIVSLGILSLPRAVRVLGLIPGIVALVGFGLLSLYAGVVYGHFKLAYPQVATISDAGRVLFGPVGEWIFGVSSVTVLIFILAAHLGSFSIAMNVLTGHATCSIVFAVVATIASIICSLPRKLEDLAFLSVISCVSIVSAALVCLGAVAYDKPDAGHIELVGDPDFAEAMTALLNIILAYAGHVTFFGFIAEMKDPKDFTKSLMLMETSAMLMYIIFAVVVYSYAGAGVLAPALSSASPIARKVAYGLALPTIIIAGVINGHIACKNVWKSVWTKNKHVLRERSFRSWSSWLAITLVAYFIAWVIAEAIPDFHQLLALVSALFMGFFSYGVTGLFWLKINWHQKFASKRLVALTIGNVVFLLVGAMICGFGLAASGINISNKSGGASFSCVDNSTPQAQGH